MSAAGGRTYDCVIFDLDGTLLDTRAAMVAALDAVLAQVVAPPIAAAALDESLHFGLGAMLRRALAAANVRRGAAEVAELEERLLTLYQTEAARRARPFPDLHGLLRGLLSRGIWTAVCSNQAERSVRGLLESFGLLGFFRDVAGGDTLALSKPDPAPLVWLMRRAGHGPTTTLMVGDSGVDAVAAERAGCDCVILDHGYGAACAGPRPHRLADFAALAELLAVGPSTCGR